MKKNLYKKTVLITGSTSGIGLGIAKAFAEKGYNIVFNGLEKNGSEISLKIARKYQIDHVFSEANMLDPRSLRDLVAQSVSHFGTIDVLINNAGIHGVIGFTKAIALEGAPFNIACNAICPGYVKTPLVEMQIGDQAKIHNLSEQDVVSKVLLKKQAVKEFIPIELIARMALFLASDEATTITGTAMPVDGGWSAQ